MKAMKKDITLQSFIEAVCEYERVVLQSEYNCEIKDVPSLFLFNGGRRKKIVIITIHKMPGVQINQWLSSIVKVLDEHPDYSEAVELFCTVGLARNKQEELERLALEKYKLALSIFDESKLTKIDSFSGIFLETKTPEGQNTLNEGVLFDFLSASKESHGIKNGIYYTILLFLIFENDNISMDRLKVLLGEKLKQKIGSIEEDIRFLKREKKVVPSQQNKNLLSVSDDVRTQILDAQYEAKETEQDFISKYEIITKRYKITEPNILLDKLKGIVKNNYIWNLDDTDKNEIAYNKRAEKAFDDFKEYLLETLSATDCESLLKDIKELCSSNHYLDKLCAGTAFISLYNSDKFEKYINQKMNYVLMDTPVIANYICYKSKYTQDYLLWEDVDFSSTASLTRLSEQSKGLVKLCVPYHYLIEVSGEISKALKLSWFEQFDSIPIPVQTGNTFFNYYLYIKSEKKKNGESVSDFSFSKFMYEIGFPCLDPFDGYFEGKTIKYIINYLKVLGCVIISKNELHLDNMQDFNDIFDDYYYEINKNRIKRKTEPAAKTDTRISLYLIDQSLKEGKQKDFYLCSWDKSLRLLRDISKATVKNYKSYAIYRPSILINRISLKGFKINNECLTNELFVFADKNYNVSDKVQRLFDDILCPYFSSTKNPNSDLVKSILQMTKSDVDSIDEGIGSSRETNLPFENFFNGILDSLEKYDCTIQNLKEFLSEEKNSSFIKDTFKKGIESYRTIRNSDTEINSFCKQVQKFVDNQGEDILIEG